MNKDNAMTPETRQAQPALPERRQSDSIALSAFFDGHPVATFAIDTSHVVTHWNSACEQLLGFTAADAGTCIYPAWARAERKISRTGASSLARPLGRNWPSM